MNGAAHHAPVESGADRRTELRTSDRENALVSQAMRRVEAILNAPEASGACAELAKHLAFQTQEPVSVALGILRVATAGAARPADEKWERFFQGKPS